MGLWSEIRIAGRLFRSSPGLAVVAVLGLGLSANAVIFSLVNGVALRPLPFPQPSGLVGVWEVQPEIGPEHHPVSPPTYFDWRESIRSLEDLGAYVPGTVVLTDGDLPERVSSATVTASLVSLLGARVERGRLFSPGDEKTGAEPVALLSHRLWERRFGSDPGLVGRRLTTDEGSLTVVGILPAGFDFPEGTGVWVTTALPRDDFMRGARFLTVIGRLKPGVDRKRAEAELQTVARQLGEKYPADQKGYSPVVVPLKEQIVGEVRPALLMLLVAVGLLVLILCIHVSSLLLARASARLKEISLKTALGASRGRALRPLVVESLLVAGLGGLLGVLLAVWWLRLLLLLAPPGLPRLEEVSVDGTSVLFTLALSTAAGLLAAVAPTAAARRADPGRLLHSSASGAPDRKSRLRLQEALAVIAIAATLVLLLSASLLLTSFLRLQGVDPGFEADRLLTARIELPPSRYPDGAKQAVFFRELLGDLSRDPRIDAAGAVTNLPLSGTNMLFEFTQDGRSPSPGEAPRKANYRAVEGGYFKTLEVRLVSGRLFTASDHPASPPVVVINQRMADLFWPGEDPLGRKIRIAYEGGRVARRIVGIVGNIRHFGLDRAPESEMYVPLAQNPWPFAWIALRTGTDPLALAPILRRQVRLLDPAQAVDQISTMESLRAASIAKPRFYTLVVGLFAFLALVSAMVGIYGLVAYTAQQRLFEIGVRMAHGALPRQVLLSFVGRGLRLALLGVALGSLAALAQVSTLESLLYGVEPTDPVTWGLAALLLVLASVAGSFIPARRASRLDPARVLREA